MTQWLRGTSTTAEYDEDEATAESFRLQDSLKATQNLAVAKENHVVNQLQNQIGSLFQTAQSHYQNAERNITGGIEQTISNLRTLGQRAQSPEPTFPLTVPNPWGRTQGAATFGEQDDTRVGLPEMPLTTQAAEETLDTSGFSPNAPGLAAEGLEGTGFTDWMAQGDPNAPSAFTALAQGGQQATDALRSVTNQLPPMSTPRMATGAMQGMTNMLSQMGSSADEIRRTAREGDTADVVGNVLAGAGTAVSPGSMLHGAAREVGIPDTVRVGDVDVPAANLAGLAGDVAMPATALDNVIGALTGKGAKLTKELLQGTAQALNIDPGALLRRAAELGHDVLEGVGEVAGAVGRAAEREMAPSVGAVTGEGGQGSRRFYHGTGSAFDAPTANKFDPNGLFGPGYYLTDEPRVASSYAEQRTPFTRDIDDARRNAEGIRGVLSARRRAAPSPENDAEIARLEQQLESNERRAQMGQQVRPVDVPADLNLFDAERTMRAEEAVTEYDHLFSEWRRPAFVASMRELERVQGSVTGTDVYKALADGVGNKSDANRILYENGWDGVRYSGGKRVPMMDGTGTPIEHEAVAVFGDSLPKLRNALSGKEGGIVSAKDALASVTPPFARAARKGLEAQFDIGSGIASGAVGAATAPEDATWQERVGRGVTGALLGAPAAASTRALARMGRTAAAEVSGITPPNPAALQKLRAMNQAKPPSRTAGRNLGAELRERFTDEYAYLKDLEDAVVANIPSVAASGETAYNKAIRYAGARGKIDALLRREVAPTFKQLQQDGNTIDDLQTYLRASQVPELEAQGFKNPGGMTAVEANGALAQLAQDLGPAKYAALEARAQELYDFQTRILNQMGGGLLSGRQVTDISAKGQKFYPHIVMDLADEAGAAYTSGRGGNLSVGASGVAKRKGSERAVMNPLEAIVSRAYSRLDRIERNSVAETIVRDVQTAFPTLVRKKKAGEVLSVGEGTISYMKDGVKQDFVVPAPYAEVAKRLDDQQAGAFAKIAGAINSVSRAGFTAMNPDFIVRNLPRDAATAFYREGLFPLGPHHLRGILSAITKDADWDAYMRSGAAIGGLFEGGAKETVQSLSGQRTPLQTLGKTITSPRDLLQYVNGVLEQGTRIGVFTQRSGLRKGPSLPGPLRGMIGEPEISPARAAIASRRGPGVDFATRNAGRWVRAMNPVILFLSARSQGAANITEPLIQRSGAARARAMGRLGLLATAAASAYAWNREQRGSEGQSLYQDIPRYERDNNIVIITGTGKTEDGKEVPAYIRIPKGDAQKIAWNAIEDGLQWAEGTNQRGVDEALSALIGSTVPIADFEGLLPPVVDTALEIGNDVDFYRNMPIEGETLRRLPPEDRVRAGTTETARAASRAIGGKFSPVQIDHMVNNLLGGAGRSVMRAADTAGRVAGVFPQADTQPSAAVQAGRTPLVAGVFGARGGELDREAYQAVDRRRAQLTAELLREIENDPSFNTLSRADQQAIRQRVANRVNARFTDERKVIAR